MTITPIPINIFDSGLHFPTPQAIADQHMEPPTCATDGMSYLGEMIKNWAHERSERAVAAADYPADQVAKITMIDDIAYFGGP